MTEQAAHDGGHFGLCAGCAYADSHLDSGRCMPGDSCVRAHSGRQIDRFFRANKDQAEHFLADLFWERRAIAARYAPIELIGSLVNDNDEIVRRVVVDRIPADSLIRMVSDPDREVRLGVVARIPEEHLHRLLNDPDYLIRATVARRLPHGQLAKMAKDKYL